MDASHHMAAVMELDLRTCHPSTLVDRINAVPALKTSAAFFTFLRANLVITASDMSSNASTPVLEPVAQAAVAKSTGLSTANGSTASAAGSTAAAAAPSNANGAAIPLDDIPPLTLGVLTTHEDKVDALQLVADSIAQQRQAASRSLVFHPLNLAVLAAGLAIGYQVAGYRDLGTALTISSGIIMTYLLSIRYAGAQYLRIAENLRWDWIQTTALDGQSTAEDTLIGARYGKEMIGALVLRLEPAPSVVAAANAQQAAAAAGTGTFSTSGSVRRKSHSRGSGSGSIGAGSGSINSSANALKGGRGVIRAWTTILRYRRRGIGGDLLNEAVRVTRERCGRDAVVGFAQEHANSQMVLPEMYNKPFRSSERLAQQVLDKVLAELDGSRRKR